MIWDRQRNVFFEEDVYGGWALSYVYGSRFDQRVIRFLVSRFPLFSMMYGFIQTLPFTKRKIDPFVKRFHIDMSECVEKDFNSFRDFFVRKIKPRALPKEPFAVIPADGRYRFFPSGGESIVAKGAFYSLEALVGDKTLAKRFEGGPIVIARLAPPDYHRFHALASGTLKESVLIPGSLYSVSSLGMQCERFVLSRNRRVRTEIETDDFGSILYIEVGATNVGSIQQTKKPGERIQRGEEKGFFDFGGSLIVILFEKGKIRFQADLLEKGSSCEILCKMGEPLGLPIGARLSEQS